ncbi:MAG: serine hydrolase domain-containing protein, partial [Vicinamibacterales bacterium]|nr:serine hydrolase domain-containing protein [Vicinamibacterales bacterium]
MQDQNRRAVARSTKRACLLACLFVGVQVASVFAEIDRARLGRLDDLVAAAIRDGRLPGAVVVVGHAGEIVYERAFGARAVDGPPEAMTLDTIFDLASLTKVVATTTSVMILVEEGRLRLRDRAVAYLPEFASHGKDRITIEHLLTHVSGLRPDLPLEEVFEGAGVAIARAADEVPEASPGERVVYSDINFFVLGEIVQRVTGQTLDQFAHDRIFQPLGMTDTGFRPSASLTPRIAPTEPCGPLAWP